MLADGSWETDVKRQMVELGMRRVDVDAGIWETKSGRQMKDSDDQAGKMEMGFGCMALGERGYVCAAGDVWRSERTTGLGRRVAGGGRRTSGRGEGGGAGRVLGVGRGPGWEGGPGGVGYGSTCARGAAWASQSA